MTNITDEQRAAWQRLSNRPGANQKPGATVEADAALIEPLLPSELTNPHPVLPTEPGTTIYGGCDQPRTMFRLDYGSSPRHWIDQYGERRTDAEARDLMGEWEETPPSVPERPEITREQVRAAFDEADSLGINHGTRVYADTVHAALLNEAAND